MRPLNAGIIGLGVGEQHGKAWAAHPGCYVTWLCDLDAAKLEACRSDHSNARVTFRAEELIEADDVDAVVIASYDEMHADQIVVALDKGKHVFVEKPICQTAVDLGRIEVALARHPDLVFQSNLILRRSPRLKALKQAIESGEFGEVYYVEADYAYGRLHKITEGWRGRAPYYSVMAGGGIHVIDVALWLTGRKAVEVQGYGNRIASRGTQFNFDDFRVALVRLDDGSIVKASANFGCVHPHSHLFAVYGTRQSFVQNAAGACYLLDRDGTKRPASQPHLSAAKGDLIPQFAEAIRQGTTTEISRDEILESMRVCVAIDTAVEQSRAVPLKEFEAHR